MIDLILNGTNLRTEYGLYLTGYDVGVSEPNTAYIEVPGASGKLDITDFLGVTYKNRTITATLAARDDYAFSGTRAAIEALNGTVVTISISSDSGIYWRGRMSIEKWESEHGRLSKVGLTVDAAPRPYNAMTGAVV